MKENVVLGVKKWQPIWLWLFAIVLILVIIGYHLKLLHQESLVVEKNSYAYYFLTPKVVRKIPTRKPSSKVTYLYSTDMGFSMSGIKYKTSASETEILKYYHDYFEALEYQEDLETAKSWGKKLAFQTPKKKFFFVNMYHYSIGKEVYVSLYNFLL